MSMNRWLLHGDESVFQTEAEWRLISLIDLLEPAIDMKRHEKDLARGVRLEGSTRLGPEELLDGGHRPWIGLHEGDAIEARILGDHIAARTHQSVRRRNFPDSR
jgi:hypothetical protein